MSALGEALRDRDWPDIAAVVEGPADAIDAGLAALWASRIATHEPVAILGMASLWTTREQIAAAACACARLVIGRTKDPRARAAVETTEMWARGEATFEEVWDAGQAAGSAAYDGDAIAEVGCDAASAAGDRVRGFDEHALEAAQRVAESVVELGCDARHVSQILIAALPSPTLVAMTSTLLD
ncbi:MAG: hypothetical protein QM831_25585 [Kofleriaceae bacterium]